MAVETKQSVVAEQKSEVKVEGRGIWVVKRPDRTIFTQPVGDGPSPNFGIFSATWAPNRQEAEELITKWREAEMDERMKTFDASPYYTVQANSQMGVASHKLVIEDMGLGIEEKTTCESYQGGEVPGVVVFVDAQQLQFRGWYLLDNRGRVIRDSKEAVKRLQEVRHLLPKLRN